MCNRRQQENEFSDFFIANLKQLPACPQVFLIRGEEKECHDSLIERLVSTRIKQVAEKKWGAQQSAIVFKTPDWAYDGTLPERQLELKRTLFSEFDPAYMEDELSAIQPHEVHDWFSRYNIYDEKKRHELSEKIFETQDGRKATHLNMADIEHALFQIHQTYVRERGYL